MCGRIDIDKQQISDWTREWFGFPVIAPTNHDLRPTQTVAAVGSDGGQLEVPWGVKPGWSKKLLINAQGETVAKKRTFMRAFAERRCLVPCSGWYEWRDEGGPRKAKYRFSAASGQALLMAGILLSEAAEKKLVTLTITPNRECAEYHHRMPCFVSPDSITTWLGGSTEDALSLVRPMPDDSVEVVASK